MINLDVKGNLAKLLATENIVVQHNNVKTASFDVKNRVLTLPIFKQKSGDVYDMLIAHECAHALWTPYEKWQGIDNDELRSYVNVIEDTRIDKLIQAKYPGVVRNYQNGFDILEKQNFFGINGKDINKDLMIIDKINLRSKSLNRLPFMFAPKDNEWLAKVDNVKTFDDVLTLAKEMLDWQKEQVEEMKKLPDFDDMSIIQSYDLGNDEDDFGDDDGDQEEQDGGQGSDSGDEENDDADDEKNDFNNFGDQKADDEKESDSNNGSSSKSDDKKEEEKSDEGTPDSYAKGAGGITNKDKKLKAITDDSYQKKQEDLLEKEAKGYNYGKIPTPNLGKDGCLTGYKTFLKDMNAHRIYQRKYYDVSNFDKWLDKSYKSFMNENKKTVMYLVKEFEMKKSAAAYKRASQDKTGIIDPLKLPTYKYNEDIFKKLTIIPDGKNHGMMMLLDWSGSMSDVIFNTVKQLINLVEFCRKVNIPYEVYFFTSERHSGDLDSLKAFSENNGEYRFENFHLVNCVSHRMSKRENDHALKTLYQMGHYFDNRYVYRRKWIDDRDEYYAQNDNYGLPSKYYLGNTPLNESLIYMNKMIPLYKKKYGIEKLTFITLTDGAGNYPNGDIIGTNLGDKKWTNTNVYEIEGVKFTGSGNITSKLLTHIKNKHGANVIGFYILKRVRRWDIEKHIKDYKDYSDKHQKYMKLRKEMTQNKAIAVDENGYHKYFILDGKKLDVENFDLSKEEVKKGTASELKRIFGKSMANRLVSRVVLNKFIQEVA